MKLLFLILITINSYAVYDNGSRQDYFEVESTLHKKLMKSMAYRVYKDELRGWTFNKYWRIVTKPLRDQGLCEGEKFIEQPSMRNGCSAILVGKDLLLTAGNCTTEHYCWNDLFYWVFDYHIEKEGHFSNKIRNKKFYKCDKVLARVFDPSSAQSFALMKLKKEVINREPIKFSSKKMLNDEELVTLGHIRGSTLKYSDGAKAYDQDEKFFLANSDISGESKGSGIFNKSTGELEGMMIYGTNNYFINNNDCRELNEFKNNEAQELVIKSVYLKKLLKDFM
jgi:V8-like Glu-specific endopeptidase